MKSLPRQCQEQIDAALATGEAVETTRPQSSVLAETVSEEDFQQAVIDRARALGWKVAHFRRVRVQRQDGSVYYETPVQADGKGFVDLVLVRERCLWVELKSHTGRLTPEQEQWRDRLQVAGQDWHCFKPKDWPEIERILSG